MKIYSSFLVLSLVTVLVSCNHGFDIPTNDIEIHLDPNQHYIHFDADVSTRGAMVESNVLQDDFAVLGYQYLGNWMVQNFRKN